MTHSDLIYAQAADLIGLQKRIHSQVSSIDEL